MGDKVGSIYKEYLKILNDDACDFIGKYLSVPSLVRLKNISYFCGMDYASKDIYSFKEYISRFDHSLSVALITWKCTRNKKDTLAALFHDISTPCFSHVIDYMNKDYIKQESTECFTEEILRSDEYLLKCLKEDNINLEEIINFKNYTIVDNNRPKLCADRLDGVILTGLFWTQNLNINQVKNIINSLAIYINEDSEKEIGFKEIAVLKLVVDVNKSIDLYCHSNEDNYMMELLSDITKTAILKGYIKYEDLYKLTEDKVFSIFENCNDDEILNKLALFKYIKLENIPNVYLPNVKIRSLKPLINGIRFKKN